MADQDFYTDLPVYCKATECGIGDKLFASVLIGDLQEAAERSSSKDGYGTDFLRENNICWIILRMHLKFNRLPSWHEQFTIRTWGTDLKKISYGRDFEIRSEDGALIGQATSTWILADMGTHRPVIARKRPELPPYDPTDRPKVFGEDCPKLVFPEREEVEKITSKPVISKYADFSELDRNLHVNNSRYTAWAYDVLYKYGIDVDSVSEIIINYVAEVKAGEKVDLFLVEQEGSMLICGYKNEDVKAFCVEIRLGGA